MAVVVPVFARQAWRGAAASVGAAGLVPVGAATAPAPAEQAQQAAGVGTASRGSTIPGAPVRVAVVAALGGRWGRVEIEVVFHVAQGRRSADGTLLSRQRRHGPSPGRTVFCPARTAVSNAVGRDREGVHWYHITPIIFVQSVNLSSMHIPCRFEYLNSRRALDRMCFGRTS